MTGTWRVERRWTRRVWFATFSDPQMAWDAFHYYSETVKRGSLHLFDDRGRRVIWCKAGDSPGTVQS
jgi:hypothetical protein